MEDTEKVGNEIHKRTNSFYSEVYVQSANTAFKIFFFKLKFLVLMEDFFLNLYNLYTLWWRAGLFFVFQTLKYIGKYREGFNMSPFFAGDQWDATTF